MSEYIVNGNPVISRQLTNEEFLETSNSLWGSTDYGVTAISLLEMTKRHADTAVWSFDRESVDKTRSKVTPRTEQEMQQIVLDMWDQAHYPFEPQVEYHNTAGPDGSYPTLSIASPGLLTRLRLADFSQDRNYNTHEFHGTLGKTFDVLAVVSGLKKSSEVGSAHVETEFITVKGLRSHLGNVGLSQHYRNKINSELFWAANDAVYNTKDTGRKEVIFEGVFMNPGTMRQKFERVAVSSLVAMADRFPEDQPTARALRALAK